MVLRPQFEFRSNHAGRWFTPATWPHTVVRLHEALKGLMSAVGQPQCLVSLRQMFETQCGVVVQENVLLQCVLTTQQLALTKNVGVVTLDHARDWLRALRHHFTALNWVSNPQSRQVC